MCVSLVLLRPNGLRNLRWGGEGEAVQPEKGRGVETAWDVRRIPGVRRTICWAVAVVRANWSAIE